MSFFLSVYLYILAKILANTGRNENIGIGGQYVGTNILVSAKISAGRVVFIGIGWTHNGPMHCNNLHELKIPFDAVQQTLELIAH
jgi:hypothetical protein